MGKIEKIMYHFIMHVTYCQVSSSPNQWCGDEVRKNYLGLYNTMVNKVVMGFNCRKGSTL